MSNLHTAELTSRVISVAALAAVLLIPIVSVQETDAIPLVGIPFFLVVTIPIQGVFVLPLLLITLGWQWAQHGRSPSKHVYAIAVIVPAISTLPGMVVVHRELFDWHDYRSHIPFSLLVSVTATVLFSNLATLSSAKNTEFGKVLERSSLYWAVTIAAVNNFLFPWWPLD